MAKALSLILLVALICNLDVQFGPQSVQAASRKQERRQDDRQQRSQQRSGGSRRQQGGGSGQQKNNGPDDPYKILGVKKNAKDKEIKSAYRKLALKYHVSL